MELIAVPARAAVLTEGRGPGGEFSLSHRTSGLSRGLELDEEVLVVDPEGDFHAATVIDIEFELEDTRYVLQLGVRLPPEQVKERLAGRRPAPVEATGPTVVDDLEPHGAEVDPGPDAISVDEVLELLARLRDEPGR